MSGPGTCSNRRIEAEAEVIVKRVGSRKLAVAGFAVGRLGRRSLTRIFGEIEVSYDRVDIALAEIGEPVCQCGVIDASERSRKLGFERCEVCSSEVFGGGNSWTGILVFKEVQISIVPWPCGGGATVGEFVMTLLQRHTGFRTASRMLISGLRCQLVRTIILRLQDCEKNPNAQPQKNGLRFAIHGVLLSKRWEMWVPGEALM